MLTEHQTSNNLSNQVCLMTEGHLASWCIQRSHLWRTYCESNMEMRKDGGGGMSAPSGASSVPAQSSCYKSALIVLLLLVTGLFVGLLIGESMCFVIKLNCTWTCTYEFDSSKKKKWKKISSSSPVATSLLGAGGASFHGDSATQGPAIWSCSTGGELWLLHSADLCFEVSG